MPDEPESPVRSEKDRLADDKIMKSPQNERRSYYYDDAHGYEDFDPEDVDDNDEDNDND